MKGNGFKHGLQVEEEKAGGRSGPREVPAPAQRACWSEGEGLACAAPRDEPRVSDLPLVPAACVARPRPGRPAARFPEPLSAWGFCTELFTVQDIGCSQTPAGDAAQVGPPGGGQPGPQAPAPSADATSRSSSSVSSPSGPPAPDARCDEHTAPSPRLTCVSPALIPRPCAAVGTESPASVPRPAPGGGCSPPRGGGSPC